MVELVHVRLIKKGRILSLLRRNVFASLPEPSGFAAAIRTLYHGMDTTKGHAMIEGRICSPLSCHRDSGRKSRAPSADTRTVLGIDCRADPVGQTCSALASTHSSMDAEAHQRSAPLPSTPCIWSPRWSRRVLQPVLRSIYGVPRMK